MRLNLTLSPNADPVAFNHLHYLTGALHKWLGEDNDYHDGLSLYAFGWLKGGTVHNGSLAFPRGARWRLSFFDAEAAERVASGILARPDVAYGMRVDDVARQAVPAFGAEMRFKVDSPVVTRTRRDDGSREYLTYEDPRADETMTQTLRTKLQSAGFEGDDLDASVRFDRSYEGARTKLSEIKGIKHKASLCPVIVTGTPHAVRAAWTVGIGELTGSGFGALL